MVTPNTIVFLYQTIQQHNGCMEHCFLNRNFDREGVNGLA
jgi:hypothetical protein